MSEPLYYIQNAGSVGNCALWWAEGGHGYTCNLAEAWKVPRSQALNICMDRAEDSAWPVETIDPLAFSHVHVGTLIALDRNPKPPAPACRFYGRYAARELQKMVAQGGNQCALIEDRYAPCCMETAGQHPDWSLCVWNTPAAKFTTDRLDTYKLHEFST